MVGNEASKGIVFSTHALEQMPDRGATEQEVVESIQTGERVPALRGRFAYRKTFPFESSWKGRYYEAKQVMPIVAEEESTFVW